MPLNLDYDQRLNIYLLNNRPLDLTSFARACVVEMQRMSERIADLEKEVFSVAAAKVEQAAPIDWKAVEAPAHPPTAAVESASAMEITPAPPAYKRTKKNKTKE